MINVTKTKIQVVGAKFVFGRAITKCAFKSGLKIDVCSMYKSINRYINR